MRNRLETFCYGPLSCGNYRMGPARDVPGGEARAQEMADELRERYRRRRNLMAELDRAVF